MRKKVGLWIDHIKAIIVTVMGEEEETRRVRSNIEKYVYFSGGSYASPLYGTCDITGEEKRVRSFASFLTIYYEDIASLIRYADLIWIIGPGEAKGELEKHLRLNQPNAHIISTDTVGKMTDRQIVAIVREHFQASAFKNNEL